MRVAEALRKKIEANVIPWAESVELRATMTFGVAQHVYGDSMQDTITKTDHALYFGKEKRKKPGDRLSGRHGWREFYRIEA